jgi:hypothetical protein
MSHVDTLKIFEDLVASGTPSEQARAQVKALDDAFDGVDAVRRAELELSMELLRKDFFHSVELLRKDFFGLKLMVLGMAALFAVPVIQKLFT